MNKTTKPFDISKCPPATPTGLAAQTRDGQFVRIVCTDGPGNWPLTLLEVIEREYDEP